MKIKLIFIFPGIVLLCHPIHGQDKSPTLQELKTEILKDIYQGDLHVLKESYSSSINTVTIFGTVMILFFTIIQLFRERQYSKLQSKFENSIVRIEKKINEIDNEIFKVRRTHTDAQRQSRVIETETTRLLLAKFRREFRKNWELQDYSRCLITIKNILRIDPADEHALYMRILCHVKQGNTMAALASAEKLLKVYPNNHMGILNYADLALSQRDFDLYSEIHNRYAAIIDSKFNGRIARYFDAFESYLRGNRSLLKQIVHEYTQEFPEGAHAIKEYDFSYLKSYLKKLPDSDPKELFERYIDYISGGIPLQEMKAQLNATPSKDP